LVSNEQTIRHVSGQGLVVHRCDADGLTLFGPLTPTGEVDCITGVAHLTGFAHEADARRDALGRIAPTDNAHARAGLLDTPLIEEMALHMRNRLLARGVALPDPRHPFGAGKRAVCLTHDVDSPQLYTAFQMARALALAPRRRDQWETFRTGVSGLLRGRPDPFWNFEGWADLIAGLGGTSTVFVYPGRTAHSPRHPRDPRYDPTRRRYCDALRGLAARGQEIGLHHAINTDTVPGYRAASERIRDIVGQPPVGARAHYWRINWQAPHQSWQAMRDAGLDYDASLSPLDLGYRCGASLPILGGTPAGHAASLVVLPTAIMDWYAEPRALSDVPAAHARVDKLLEDGRRHGLVVLNWHIRTLTNLGAWARLGDLAQKLLGELASDSDTRFMSAAQISTAWRAHCAALVRDDGLGGK
jgi:hypothetical protein